MSGNVNVWGWGTHSIKPVLTPPFHLTSLRLTLVLPLPPSLCTSRLASQPIHLLPSISRTFCQDPNTSTYTYHLLPHPIAALNPFPHSHSIQHSSLRLIPCVCSSSVSGPSTQPFPPSIQSRILHPFPSTQLDTASFRTLISTSFGSSMLYHHLVSTSQPVTAVMPHITRPQTARSCLTLSFTTPPVTHSRLRL